ncbi:MAG: 60S ribosomal export protein NMD3 [Candidatus Nanohaloarchaea archaeon]|nr:60S ribosomal export protein NMD3 [Candidatus Nanohaloarchaea archaeon]
MQKFCPKCGEEADDLFGSRGLCRDCFEGAVDLVDLPEEITFDQCSVCASYKVKNTWKDFESDQKLIFDLLRPYEKEEVEMSASFRKKGEKYIVNVLMEKPVKGEIIQQTSEVVLKPEKKQCKKCARYAGGYFEVIVQLRGNISEDMFGELMESAGKVTSQDRNDFISNVEEIDQGYDVFVSSKKMARSMISFLEERFKLEKKWSRELVGEEEGEKIYRTVVSVRIGEQVHG